MSKLLPKKTLNMFLLQNFIHTQQSTYTVGAAGTGKLLLDLQDSFGEI
jgi:hypothetical protein